MNASPAAETTAPLGRPGRERDAAGVRRRVADVAAADLATGPGRTIADPGRAADEVTVPAPAGSGSAYIRLEFRRAMEIAVVGAAALVTSTDGRIAAPGSP